MLSNTILTSLNDQIAAEFGASNFYLQVAAWFDNNNYEGFAKYFRKQSDEERQHGLKIVDYLLETSSGVQIKDIQAPDNYFVSCLGIFEAVYALEDKVTSLISNIYKISVLEGDYATQIFLQWYVQEQVRSMRDASYNLNKIRQIGDDVGALFEFDEYLGEKE